MFYTLEHNEIDDVYKEYIFYYNDNLQLLYKYNEFYTLDLLLLNRNNCNK